MHLTANMSKIVSVKANAQEIAAVNCICHQICTKWLLWRQMLRNIVTWKCFWCHHICTKSITLQGYAMEIFPWMWHLYMHICSPWDCYSDRQCDQVLYYCHFKMCLQCSHSMYTESIHIAVEANAQGDSQGEKFVWHYVCHHTRSYIEICMPVDDFWSC